MTTDAMPTFRQFAAFTVMNALQRATRPKRTVDRAPRDFSFLAMVTSLIRVVLHLAGFGLLTWAGFSWNMIAGLIVAAGSCFVLSYLVTSRGGNA